MNKTPAQIAAASLLPLATANLAALAAMADTLGAAEYVLENQGVYISMINGKPVAGGLPAAARYTLAQASRLAPMVKNGNDLPANVLSLADAYALELNQAQKLLALLKERA